MKKYNDNDVVRNFLDVDISVEEVIEEVWEVSGDNLYWNVEDEVKKWSKSFEGGKKYIVRGKVGSRGYYEGLEVIREGSNREVFEESMCGCINYEDGCEFNEEESYYYYIVSRLRKEEV